MCGHAERPLQLQSTNKMRSQLQPDPLKPIKNIGNERHRLLIVQQKIVALFIGTAIIRAMSLFVLKAGV